MSGWRCFMLIPSNFMRRSLRRYQQPREGLKPCPRKGGIHEAKAIIDARFIDPDLREGDEPVEPWLSDPRWPALCACGHEFLPGTTWQVLVDRLYQGSPDGLLHTLDSATLAPGAMWDAPWIREANSAWAGADGRSLVVRLPSGSAFPIDVPSMRSSERWTRSGIPPVVTLDGSVDEIGRYHGTLSAGVLSEDQEGRGFPGLPRTA